MLRLDPRPGVRVERRLVAWLLTAALLFAAVYVLRLFDENARNGIAFLYAVPIAALALCFGLRGGLLGAALAMVLVFADGNPELVLTPVGHATRAAILFIVGASIGWFVDREHHWQRERLDQVEAERRASAARMLTAQERERVRLARELHDEIGQSVTGLMLEIDRLGKRAPESLRSELRDAQELARQISDELRTIVRRLRPEALDQLGLNRALIALTDRLCDQGGVVIERELARDLPPLSPEAELVIYRVAQESLTNVVRHAGASSVTIELRRMGDALRLRVADDGHGLPRGAMPSSGIQGMRERALLVDAELTIASRPRGGTEVTLRLPLAAGEAPAEETAPVPPRRGRTIHRPVTLTR